MLTFRLRGISGTGDKAETRAETSNSYSQHPFVLLPMRVEVPQNKPNLKFSTALKMGTPPFPTVVVQSLINRVTEEAQPCRFKFGASGGDVEPERILKSNHCAIVTNCNLRQHRILDLKAMIHFW
jgi:hypothetical protein